MRKLAYAVGISIGNALGIVGVIIIGFIEEYEARRKEAESHAHRETR